MEILIFITIICTIFTYVISLFLLYYFFKLIEFLITKTNKKQEINDKFEKIYQQYTK